MPQRAEPLPNLKTKEQHTMATQPKFHTIHKSVRTIVKEAPKSNSSSLGERIAQLVKVYAGIRPLLKSLDAMIFPPSWHKAIDIFIVSLDAVVAGAGEIDATFKAGKDL